MRSDILLAVSGGCDSMYLANRAGELFRGKSFAVAHCNFQLRGEESDGDEAFVKAWCEEKGIRFFSKRFDTVGYAAEKGISIEMAARELRYGWFAELCNGAAAEQENGAVEGFGAVAVAHNANDNAETLLLNMLRGTGTRGMRGMSRRGVCPGAESVPLLRPLLGITREEIAEWMKTHGCTWREDSTNAESDYKRNKIRNLVFPVFKELNPSFIQTLNSDIARIAQADDIASDLFKSFKDSISLDEGIPVNSLLEQKHWKFILWRLLEDCNFSQPTFEKLTSLLERYKNEPRGTVTLGGKIFESPDCKLYIKNKKLCLEKNR